MAEGESETTGSMDALKKLRKEEDSLLLEEGFKSVESNALLWVKDSVCYGREAALQQVARRR